MQAQIRATVEQLGSPLFKFAFGLASLGLALALVSFSLPSIPAAMLCFFFCACWLIWSVCAVLQPNNNGLRLVSIWVIIDFAILAMFVSITNTNGDVTSAIGTEVVWLISYFPTIIPLAIALPPLAHQLEAAARGYTEWISPAYGGVASSWVAMSFIAMLQSLALVLLSSVFHRLPFKRHVAKQ